jgi:hypothetical protein
MKWLLICLVPLVILLGLAASSASAEPPPLPPGGGSGTAQYTATGTYTVTSGTKTKSGGTISSSTDDKSAVLVRGGTLTLKGVVVKTSGNTKSNDESSFYGLNAGILAQSSGTVVVSDGSVTTSGSGANGVFAYGSSASAIVNGTKIVATGQGAHGVMASGGGTVRATDVTISTAGASSAAIATDRGGGTIVVNGGTMTTSGGKSPGIYSTGKIVVSGATLKATGAEAAVVEGGNSISLVNSNLSAGKSWGVMLYNSMSGDATSGTGTFTMSGGSLTASTGPAFRVTNTKAVITLTNKAKITATSGILLQADNRGTGSGNTGAGTVTFRANRETLKGNLVAVGTGSISASLNNHTKLIGTLTEVALTLDSTSTWAVTGNSTLTSLSGAKITGSKITNIVGNGHTVTYDKSLAANSKLAGKTYTLAGGGTLVAK